MEGLLENVLSRMGFQTFLAEAPCLKYMMVVTLIEVVVVGWGPPIASYPRSPPQQPLESP